MDPEQTLQDIHRAIEEYRPGDAVELLENYVAWRRNGGFEPILSGEVKGDRVYEELVVDYANRFGEYFGPRTLVA